MYDDLVAGGFSLYDGELSPLDVPGNADDIVTVAENTAPFEQKIRKGGSSIQVVPKPGVNHHPHSLPNPQPIVDFILRATKY